MKKLFKINYTNYYNNILKFYIKINKILEIKEKEILKKRKIFFDKLRKQTPTFKKEFKSAFVMGLFLSISCIVFNFIYGDFIDQHSEFMPPWIPEEIPDLNYCDEMFTYELTKLQVLKIRPVVAWIFNDLIDIHNCPIQGVDPGTAHLYFP